MSDWSNIWQGIGQLGQTKRGSYEPLRQAVSGGLGKIADTIGNIAGKRFQAGEAEKQRGFITGEREASQDYDANQAVLDRALERDKMWMTFDIANMDREKMRKEAAADRALQRDLRAASEAATDARQKADLEEQARQFDEKVDQWQQEFDRAGLQWEDEMGLKERGLDIEERNADLEANILQAQLTTMKDPKAGAIWKEIKGNLIDDFSTLFQGVDTEGYAFEAALWDIARSNPDVMRDIRAQFMTYASDYSDKIDTLQRLFDGAIGTIQSEQAATPESIPTQEGGGNRPLPSNFVEAVRGEAGDFWRNVKTVNDFFNKIEYWFTGYTPSTTSDRPLIGEEELPTTSAPLWGNKIRFYE